MTSCVLEAVTFLCWKVRFHVFHVSHCLMLAGEEAPEAKGAARQEAPKGKGTTSEMS